MPAPAARVSPLRTPDSHISIIAMSMSGSALLSWVMAMAMGITGLLAAGRPKQVVVDVGV